jgi:hypothetical protein
VPESAAFLRPRFHRGRTRPDENEVAAAVDRGGEFLFSRRLGRGGYRVLRGEGCEDDPVPDDADAGTPARSYAIDFPPPRSTALPEPIDFAADSGTSEDSFRLARG